MSMKICYGLIGIVVFLLIGVLFLNVFESSLQRDCLNTGKTVVNETVYACQKIGPEVQP